MAVWKKRTIQQQRRKSYLIVPSSSPVKMYKWFCLPCAHVDSRVCIQGRFVRFIYLLVAGNPFKKLHACILNTAEPKQHKESSGVTGNLIAWIVSIYCMRASMVPVHKQSIYRMRKSAELLLLSRLDFSYWIALYVNIAICVSRINKPCTNGYGLCGNYSWWFLKVTCKNLCAICSQTLEWQSLATRAHGLCTVVRQDLASYMLCWMACKQCTDTDLLLKRGPNAETETAWILNTCGTKETKL